jgi:transcriptional regulator with XRE-family HTH domain
VANDRLRDAMLRNGLTPEAVAERIGVDPKTAERWITQGRAPYPRHRYAIAALVKEAESYLWPDALPPERAARVAASEVVHVFRSRGVVPDDLWRRLLDNASERIGVLVYGGLFLAEQNPKYVASLKAKATHGADVRVLLGNPDSSVVAQRGAEEGIGEAMAAKIRNTLAFYAPLRTVDGVSVHFHETTLYNSIFLFDDEMLVNTHIFGVPAHHAPVIHLRRLSGGDLFDSYTDSFERVWATSVPAWSSAMAS